MVNCCSTDRYHICSPHITSKTISHFLVMNHNEIYPPVRGIKLSSRQGRGDDTRDSRTGSYPAVALHRYGLGSSVAVVDPVEIDDVNEVVVGGIEGSAGGSGGGNGRVGTGPTVVVVVRGERSIEIEDGEVGKIGLHQQIPHIDEGVGQHGLAVVEPHRQRGCSLYC